MKVRTEERRQAILDIAARMFLEEGYATTTMARVSAELGGSKSTLYGYFPSKEALFVAVVERVAGNYRHALLALDLKKHDVRALLLTIGLDYLRLRLSPAALAFHRMLMGELPRFPEMGPVFFQTGPQRVVDQMETVFRHVAKRFCKPSIGTREAVLHFRALCDAWHHERLLWETGSVVTERDMKKAVKAAVDLFLKAHDIHKD